MSRRIVDRVCAIMLGFIMTIALCPGINAMAATSFYGGINYFVDGSKNGYFDGAWVDGTGGDIMFSIGGHGLYDELNVNTSTRVVEIKNLVPDYSAGDGDLWFNPSMVFSSYRINLSGNNRLSAMIIGAADFTITVAEGSDLTIIGTASTPAISGNGIVRIGEKTRAILTNASGETIINAGETLPTDGPLEQKVYTKAEFIGLIDLSGKQSAATLSFITAEYTGSPLTPTVSIPGLTENVDYTVAYANNTEVGTATVTITGIGKCQGTFTLNFTITAKPVIEEAKDDKGSDYKISTNGDTQEATYTAPKTKNEKKVTVPDEIKLPDGTTAQVTAIAKNAFKGNAKLTSATVGNNVKTVGDNAFNGCSKLTSLKLGKKVETIGKGAVSNCKSLKSVTVPASTKTIGKNAFKGDSKLTNLTINCKNLKSVGKDAIKNINPKATIKLKGSTKEKKAAEKLITGKNTGYKKSMKIKK